MNRANEHAKELNRTLQAFYKTNPYQIVHKFEMKYTKPTLPSVDPAKGIHVYHGVTRHPIPDRVAILSGEIMQGLRSALDYIAWQMALAKSDSPPPTTAFPIFTSQGLYDRDKARFIGGIDSIQPYHAGDKATDHPLWVLHRLANDDKHRVPHVVGSLPSGIIFKRPAGVDFATTMTIGPFEDHEEVATMAIIRGADPETQLNINFTIAVAFAKDTPARGRHLTNEIARIGREVDITIRRFEAFF